MNTPSLPEYKYNVGGVLAGTAPSYVMRQADQEFYTVLKARGFCYVFNSRQMGKSSLRTRAAEWLRAEGIACGVVDLSGIGSNNLTEAGWYQGIIGRLKSSLGIRFQHRVWWNEREDIPPRQRFVEFIETVLLVEITQPIVLFFDEIDSVFKFDFRDDFFALIRFFSEQRTEQPEYQRLTFALVGVATPADLIQDKSRTPFNIGQAIALEGFQLPEVQPLIPGLVGKAENPQEFLKVILAWTGGQPFLVQKLCQLVLNSPAPILAGDETAEIERLVRSHILENWESQDNPQHLITIRNRLREGGEQQSGRLLGLCQQIVQQGEVTADESSEQTKLRLTGLVVKQQGKLRIYNRIYAEVFNLSWFDQELGKLRPYGNELNTWVASNRQDESRLLRGQTLQEALAWASEKSLGDEDYRFLNASQEVEQRVVEEENRILEEARRKAEIKTKKANSWLRWSLLGVIAAITLFVFALFGSLYYQHQAEAAQQEASKFQGQANDFQKQAGEARQDALKAEGDRNKVRQDALKAEGDRNKARQDALKAEGDRNKARQDALKAEGDRNKAQKQAESATIERNKAAQDTQSAKQETALANQQKIEAMRQAGQARAAQLEIQEVMKLEIAGNDVLRQFNTVSTSTAPVLIQLGTGGDEIDALLSAIRIAQEVNVKFKQEQHLNEYSIKSPLLALQTILDNLIERNRFNGSDIPYEVYFSPGGQYLVTKEFSEKNQAVKIRNFSGQQLAELTNSDVFGHISFSQDGKYISTKEDNSTKGRNGNINIWNRSGKSIAQLPASSEWGYGGFSHNGEHFAAIGKDGVVRIWNLSGQEVAQIRGKFNHIKDDLFGSQLYTVSFGDDGKRIATLEEDGIIRFYNFSGQLVDKMEGKYIIINEQYIIKREENDTSKLLNFSGKVIGTFPQGFPIDQIASVSFDGKYIVTGTKGGVPIQLWGLSQYDEVFDKITTWPTGSNDYVKLSFSQNSTEDKIFAINFHKGSSGTGRTEVWGLPKDWGGPDKLELLAQLNQESIMARVSPNGQYVITGTATSNGSKIRSAFQIWDLSKRLVKWKKSQPYFSETNSSSDKQSFSSRQITIDELFLQSCNWLKDYVASHPEEAADICPNQY